MLCEHLRVDNFDCGNELLNYPLHSRFRDGNFVYDPDEGVIFVAHEDGAIRGYIWIIDVLIGLDNIEPERCFYLAYLGVDLHWQGSEVASDLIRKAYEIRRFRARRNKVYAATVGNTFYDPTLADRFRVLKFRQANGSPFLWFRRPTTN